MTDTALALLGVFAVHALAVASPGPNAIAVTQLSLAEGRAAGIAAAAGVAAGTAIWSAAAIGGLHLLFDRHAWLAHALALIGGGYLVWLGWRLWRHAAPTTDAQRAAAAPPLPSKRAIDARRTAAAFGIGLLTNLTNPKALVFFGSVFAALLPPGMPAWALVAAIAIVVANALAGYGALACLLSMPRAANAYARAKTAIDRVAGAALMLLGLRLLAGGR